MFSVGSWPAFFSILTHTDVYQMYTTYVKKSDLTFSKRNPWGHPFSFGARRFTFWESRVGL